MGNFSLHKLFAYYIRYHYIIIVYAIIFAIGGYYYETEVKVPMYESEVSLLIVEKQSDALGTNSYYENIVMNKNLVADYSELIKSRRVLSKVKDNLGLSRKIESLQEHISVFSLEDTSLINITVSDIDGKNAAKIANELANVFKSEIKDLYDLENVQIVDEAVERKVPYNIHVVRDTALAGIIGIVLACVVLFMYVFIKSKGDFDSILVKKEKNVTKKRK